MNDEQFEELHEKVISMISFLEGGHRGGMVWGNSNPNPLLE